MVKKKVDNFLIIQSRVELAIAVIGDQLTSRSRSEYLDGIQHLSDALLIEARQWQRTLREEQREQQLDFRKANKGAKHNDTKV